MKLAIGYLWHFSKKAIEKVEYVKDSFQRIHERYLQKRAMVKRESMAARILRKKYQDFN